MRRIAAALLALACSAAYAQDKTPPRSDAPAAPVRESLCERLAGVERDRCVAEEQARQDREREAAVPGGKRACDDLLGPQKELCLKRGGTVKAGTGASGSR